MSDDASSFELLPTEEVERLLPAYSQISFLARGGMAAVYQGVQTSLDRPVAIKILPREFGADESFRLRFAAEGKAMARLNHPHLVGIFDFGQVDDLLYLVMELVDGQTLHQYAHDNPLTELAAIEFCQKIAEGLAHAHEHDILHRDIKPANVLLNANLEPKLGDFGLAEGDERAEGDDLVFGTLGYTAPEVMANPEVADKTADIYSIGVMLYELLTSTIPSNPYQPPSRVSQTDVRIDAIIAKAIHIDPARRFASSEDLAESLAGLHKKIKTAPRRKLATSVPAANTARTLKVTPATSRNTPQTTPILNTGESTSPATLSTSPASKNAATLSQPKLSKLPLIRNLIIIAALSFAIFTVWEAKEKKEKAIALKEAKQEEKIARQKRKREAANKRAQVERNANPSSHQGSSTTSSPNPNSGPTIPKPEPEPPTPLTPREQLAELKSALAQGERNNFPDGTLQRGNSRYFFIDEALTWYQAIEFAENHGAHLASTPKESDLRWLSKEIPTDDDVWLGAGATSRSDWAWLNESIPFELKLPRTSTKVAGTLTNIGFFKASHPSEKLPFFIQWNADGKQLGSRQKDFDTIAKSLDTSNPVWPPGVRAYEERRYLTIGRELSQSEAATLASQAGGTLAVASNELEASFLKDYAAESGLSGLWIGGEKQKDAWVWKTNEPWEFARWSDGHPSDEQDDSGLQINATGWLSVDPYLDGPGFIIEWSDDAEGAPEVEQASHNSIEELNELRARAKRFLAKEKATADSQFKDNFTAQGMAMRQWLRNIPKEEAEALEPIYSSYTQEVATAGHRLPNPANSPIANSSSAAAKILQRHYNQQVSTNDKLIASAEKLRLSYLRKIEAILTDVKAKELTSQLGPLHEEIAAIGTSGSSFLTHLGLL